MKLAWLPAMVLPALLLAAGPAMADTLTLPPAPERSGTATAVYRLDQPVSGNGVLAIDWTDSLGRVVEHRDMTVTLDGGTAIEIPLDLGRAVAMRNTLRAILTLGEYRGSATADFVARPPAGWNDYQILMWQDQTPAQYARLAALGVSGGKVLGIRAAFTPADVAPRIAPLLHADLRWFVENIATDFYSAYHRWTPEHPRAVNWRFTALQRRHLTLPSDRAVLLRLPSLADPGWIARIRARLAATVRMQAAYRPFYYNLGDETGIADLAAAWDFDFSPVSLAAFRVWLRGQYGTLDALNREWGSDFPGWDAVMPPTTTAAMRRGDENYAGWSDFKAFMDASFAGALQAGTEAVHAADPTALAAIEGGQVPGWGGYDYGRLAHAVDVMEIYEADNNVEIARSLNPGLVVLGTAGATMGPEGRRSVWHHLLLGERGLILWDETGQVAAAGADAATYRELRDGLGALLIATHPRQDPVAILYSPASFRVRWMLDHRAQGDAWTQRGSEQENEDNAVRATMRRDAALLVHDGVQPRWLTPGLLAHGALRDGAVRVLVLPQAIALSPEDAAEIRAFAGQGGLVLADGAPGGFDGHGRRLAAPLLDGVAAMPVSGDALLGVLARARAAPGFRLTRPDGGTVDDVDMRVFDDGAVTLLGLQRDAGATTGDVVLSLPAPVFVHDVRGKGGWQRTDRVRLTLDAVEPTLLALSPMMPGAPTVSGPDAVRLGETATFRIALPTEDGTARVLHVEAVDPAGHVVARYSGNLVVHGGDSAWSLPVAMNDAPGNWTVQVRDVLGGGSTATVLHVLK